MQKSNSENFNHLKIHSQFSICEGAVRIDDLKDISKDNKLKALDLLERDGNPFEFSIYDFEGRLAIDLGVYGAPETFFIDKNGLIRERHVGVIDEKVWEEKFSKYLNE